MTVRLVDLQLLYGIPGAREQFERLTAQLIKSEFPTATSIRTEQGDGGIDVYVGNWASPEGIHVFQVKYYPNGIGDSQRSDIKKSFTRCCTNERFITKRWTLCLPRDLSIKETIWFAELKQKNENEQGITIDCWDATKLESLLYREDNRGIKETFFKEEHLTQIREMHDIITRPADIFGKTIESCKKFHEERLIHINAGETLTQLERQAPKIVLHIVPFGTFSQRANFDVNLLMDTKNIRFMEPLRLNSGGFPYPQYNSNGILCGDQKSYIQVFRKGYIEAVDASILNAARDMRFTAGYIYETRLLETLKRCLSNVN